MILSIHRGWARGVPSNAKPTYFLSIIEGIGNGTILGNKIIYNKDLESAYINLCCKFEPNVKPAFFYKPYYHLTRESFYHIHWKGNTLPKHKWHTPSGKFLKEYADYAYLDDDLWELLQVEENRALLNNCIINFFFS